MKHKVIYLAFFAIIFVIAQDFKIAVAIGALFYWRLRFNDHLYIYLLLVLFLMIVPRTTYDLDIDEARVIKIKDNYTVLKADNKKFITYDPLTVNYDDIIRFSGTFHDTDSDISNNAFDHKNWALSKDIVKMVAIDDYEVIENGNSIRAKLFDKAKMIADEPTRNFVLKLLFQYDNDEENASGILEFLGSTQTFLSSSLYLLEKILVLFLYPSTVNIIIIILILFAGYQFNVSFIIYQLLLSRLLTKIDDRYDRLGYLIIILLVINPYYVYDLRFQLVTLIRFVALFRKKMRFYDSSLVVLSIQLVNFFRADLVSIISYRVLRFYYLFLFWSVSIALVIDDISLVSMISDIANSIVLTLPELIFTGKPSVLIIFILLYLLTCKKANYELKRLIIIFSVLLVNQYQMLLYPFGEITFLNIGQGDSCLIRFPVRTTVSLIDTGSAYNQSKLQRYLDALGVKAIEAIMISHHDSDHDGNLSWLEENYEVKAIYDTKIDQIKLADYELTGLLVDKHYDDTNDDSQVLIFGINGIDYLFLGDISADVERELVRSYPNLHTDIIKIAHHGSNTSTSDYLLRSVKPSLAIISAGKENIYHHPHYEITSRLAAYRIHYLTTADRGDISIYFTRFTNLLHTSNNEFVIMNEVIK